MTLQLSVDRPVEDDQPVVTDTVVIEGWAWSPHGPPVLRVTVGGRDALVGESDWRPDVSDALGISVRGWIATAHVAGLPSGPAEVLVTATSADGAAVERRRTVIVSGGSDFASRPKPYAGFSERLDPAHSPTSSVHGEHVARYQWVAPLAEGRDVLDAGCGVGYGAALLSRAGARSVTGVDAFAAAVLDARERDRHGNTFLLGDLREIPLPDDSVDLVVCFEVIEHIEEQAQVLAELRRVLRPDGLLAISSPVPGRIDVENPHHVAELTAAELRALLGDTFAEVALVEQYTASGSVVGSDPLGPPVPVLWASGPLEPTFTLALAGDRLPDLPPPTGTLIAGFDIAQMVNHIFARDDQHEAMVATLTAEQARSRRAEEALAALEKKHARLRAELETMQGSRSWTVATRLRDAAASARRLSGRG